MGGSLVVAPTPIVIVVSSIPPQFVATPEVNPANNGSWLTLYMPSDPAWLC